MGPPVGPDGRGQGMPAGDPSDWAVDATTAGTQGTVPRLAMRRAAASLEEQPRVADRRRASPSQARGA